MMRRLFKMTFQILLAASILISAVCWPCQAADYLKYPGSGFSHLSKNRPIKELNAEIQHYASSYPQITFSQGKMNFKDISGFQFRSSKNLVGPRYCFRVPLSINSGSCSIGIGDVSYLIGPEGFRVTEKGKVVFESKKEKPIDIIVEVFSRSNSSTRFHDKEKLIAIVGVSFSEPTNISISLDNKCTGWIGPLEWLRGYE